MAEGSDNKVTMTLDLETGVFKSNVMGVETVIDNLGKKSDEAGKKSKFSFMEFNAAIEIVQKSIELINVALEKMERSEQMKAQAAALHSLGSQIGINVDTLTKAINKMTNGTVTDLQAQNAAFRLLSAGVKADAIPAFVEYADKLEKIKGIRLEDTINKLAISVESGAAKGLKAYGLELDAVGNRHQVTSALLKQIDVQMEHWGGTVDETASRATTNWKNMWDTFTETTGNGLTEIAKFLSNDPMVQSEKIHDRLMNRKIELVTSIRNLVQRQQEGDLLATKMLSEKRKELIEVEERLQKTSEKASDLKAKEKEETQKLVKELGEEVSIRRVLTDDQKKNAELQAQLRAAKSQISGADNIAQEIEARKKYSDIQKAIINEEINDRRNAILSSPVKDQEEATEKLVALEKERLDRIEALNVTANQAKQIERENRIQMEAQGQLTELESWDAHQSFMLEAENQRFEQEKELLRNSNLSKEEFKEKELQEEINHQNRMKGIKDSYNEINGRNFKLGMDTAFNQMQTQYGNFSNVTARAMNKTQSLMTNAFVNIAKGHGDAMNQMLKQFLAMIGTEMIQSGTFHLLKGIASMNPSEVGAGSALIAGGMALVSASGGGGGDTSAAGAAGGGGGSGMSPPAQAQQDQLERKSASITIMGDYMNSRETQMHLAEVLRSNSDITDYAIVAQGKNF